LRYGKDFVLLAKGQTVVWGKIDRVIDIVTGYGMEKNKAKTTIPTVDYDRTKKTEECEIFQSFGLLGAIFTREIESRIAVTKAGYDKKKAIFACKFDLKFKE
jgi:hypothetical protein